MEETHGAVGKRKCCPQTIPREDTEAAPHGLFQGDSTGDACSSAWTLGKFWALREAMKLQRVRTVGGRGESGYLSGR